jgi:hypothetical protein
MALFLYRRRSIVFATSMIVAIAGARLGFHPPSYGMWDGPL